MHHIINKYFLTALILPIPSTVGDVRGRFSKPLAGVAEPLRASGVKSLVPVRFYLPAVPGLRGWRCAFSPTFKSSSFKGFGEVFEQRLRIPMLQFRL